MGAEKKNKKMYEHHWRASKAMMPSNINIVTKKEEKKIYKSLIGQDQLTWTKKRIVVKNNSCIYLGTNVELSDEMSRITI